MANIVGFRERRYAYKIEGQAKPFIDKNLQLQPSNFEQPFDALDQDRSSSFNSLYSHYARASSPNCNFENPINEAELYHIMAEAQNSYESWKKMKEKLNKLINTNTKRKN